MKTAAETPTLSGTKNADDLRKARNIFTLLLAAAMLWSCRGIVDIDPAEIPDAGKGIGQMVLFSGGATSNNETKASDGVTYYMPDGSHFVCRMYYKAQTGSDNFDVEGGSDQTAWLKVSGNVGNSLYWNKEYSEVNSSIKGKGGVDDYGNDYSATAFYWQNRKEHAFLAWTDLNNAANLKGGASAGSLKFEKDIDYKVYVGAGEDWVVSGYKIYGLDQTFSSTSDMRKYVETTYATQEAINSFNALQKELGDTYSNWDELPSQYQFGWNCKLTTHYTVGVENTDETHRNYKWYRYLMFFEKFEFIPEDGMANYDKVYDKDQTVILKLKKDGIYVAEAEVINGKNEDGKYVDSEGTEITDPDLLTYKFYKTDENGNALYNEEDPLFSFYYQRFEEKKKVDRYDEVPALKFDLARGSRESMSEQPDIAQALEIQAPVGATQESNRVNLYFKHQFSQVQVNIKQPADGSVDLGAGDIQKVELLGVAEEAYVFTELDNLGKVKSPAYKDIDFSKYSEADLKNNPFGTSLQMFELPDADTEYGYLKSYNAITFGQLQAIRITWKESEGGAISHASTYRIPSTELMNLKSGVKYIWNIEIRRGTLAIIRTEIVDWELPKDADHNGIIEGIIQN